MAQSNSAILDISSPDWPESGGVRTPDDALIVKFYLRSVQNEFKSNDAGRPVYEDKEYLEIMTAGNQLSTIDRPAYDLDKRRFPRHYAAFKAGREGMNQQPGTPLAEWTILGPSAVKNLNALNFYTIDQIAAASDLQIEAVGMHSGFSPQVLREKAQTYIRMAKDTAHADKQAAEIAKLKSEQAANDARRDAEVAELRAMLEAATKPGKSETLTLKK